MFSGCGLADDDRAVEFIGVVEALVTGRADAGDAQGHLLPMAQPRQHLARDDGADGGKTGVVGKGHQESAGAGNPTLLECDTGQANLRGVRIHDDGTL